MGFYYFFVVQDPFILQYLDIQSIKYAKDLKQFRTQILKDMVTFQTEYQFYWVQTMLSLDLFKNTIMFGKEYSNGIAYNMHSLYYENLRIS